MSLFSFIQKLRLNKPLTTTDLAELERMLVDNHVGDTGDIELAKEKARGLGILFGRSSVSNETRQRRR
jgi:type I site-specific restriction endonuclease